MLSQIFRLCYNHALISPTGLLRYRWLTTSTSIKAQEYNSQAAGEQLSPTQPQDARDLPKSLSAQTNQSRISDPPMDGKSWGQVEPLLTPEPPVLPGVKGRAVLWVVPATEDGSRLDRFIKRRSPGLPAGLIQRLIRQRRIIVNSETANQNKWELYTNDVVRFPGDIKLGHTRGKRKPPADDVSFAEAATVRSWLLHRDARTAVLNKPAGLPVVPRGPSFVNPILLQRESKKPAGERVRLGKGTGPLGTDSIRCLQDLLYGLGQGHYWLVHRLDKDVSGAIVLARDVGAAGLLAEYFRSRVVEKTYWALVQGWVKSKEGTIQIPIDGKRAYTAYRLVHRVDHIYAWLELCPRTGRKHQLRTHCADGLGCPIVGDTRYGSENPRLNAGNEDNNEGIEASPGLHLMSRNIKYPVLTETSVGSKRRKHDLSPMRFVNVTAPLPPHMKDTWKRLGLNENLQIFVKA